MFDTNLRLNVLNTYKINGVNLTDFIHTNYTNSLFSPYVFILFSYSLMFLNGLNLFSFYLENCCSGVLVFIKFHISVLCSYFRLINVYYSIKYILNRLLWVFCRVLLCHYLLSFILLPSKENTNLTSFIVL